MIQINCNVSGTPTDLPDIVSDSGDKYPGCFESLSRCIFRLPDTTPPAGWGAYICYAGKQIRIPEPIPVTNGAYEGSSLGIDTIAYNAYPAVPTREEVLGVNMHFRGGLLVPSSQYGLMPWWPSALTWLNENDRKAVYQASANDSHVIIEVPNGKPLYNEGGQFYSPDKFGAIDWTNNETQMDSRLSDIVDEVIEAGFKFIIAMDEVQPNSTRIVQLVMEALTEKQLQYGFVIPGYDAVFYGWEPVSLIESWFRIARSIQPSCYLGMEHNVGHIPLGEGGADYKLGGRLDDCDVVLGEFGINDSNHNDASWQILGRMIRPYNRPPDQPSSDDPNPPFYLVDSPRGPRYYCAFEDDDPFHWVRVNPNDANAVANARRIIDGNTTYFRSMGCRYVG